MRNFTFITILFFLSANSFAGEYKCEFFDARINTLGNITLTHNNSDSFSVELMTGETFSENFCNIEEYQGAGLVINCPSGSVIAIDLQNGEGGLYIQGEPVFGELKNCRKN